MQKICWQLVPVLLAGSIRPPGMKGIKETATEDRRVIPRGGGLARDSEYLGALEENKWKDR